MEIRYLYFFNFNKISVNSLIYWFIIILNFTNEMNKNKHINLDTNLNIIY